MAGFLDGGDVTDAAIPLEAVATRSSKERETNGSPKLLDTPWLTGLSLHTLPGAHPPASP